MIRALQFATSIDNLENHQTWPVKSGKGSNDSHFKAKQLEGNTITMTWYSDCELDDSTAIQPSISVKQAKGLLSLRLITHNHGHHSLSSIMCN